MLYLAPKIVPHPPHPKNMDSVLRDNDMEMAIFDETESCIDHDNIVKYYNKYYPKILRLK